ncbi:hypothetical protein IE81DRAFT_321306 [Ceraceosorus guamensis]|uniref:Uncharacterized protein n=1 Tax=Ceraceosorus guamensis TaxID=1522189 RepID=A0A316W4E1_9BASI|nr:hypothetical protein IE81DRAFT_321306 [Ceraceosorus guamensis]PWN44414.1 hypothetical protein IE81DRAFT_321306 [Ceraceosorus guamensis]
MYRGRGRFSGESREPSYGRGRGRGRGDHRFERASRDYSRGERARDDPSAPPKLTGANIDAAAAASGAASGRPVRAWGAAATPTAGSTSATESPHATAKLDAHQPQEKEGSDSDELEAGEIAPSPPGSPKPRGDSTRQASPSVSFTADIDRLNPRNRPFEERAVRGPRERSPPRYSRSSYQPRHRSPVRAAPRSRYDEPVIARGYNSAPRPRERERDWDMDSYRRGPDPDRDWGRANRSRYSTPSRHEALPDAETSRLGSRTSRSPVSQSQSQGHSRTASRAVSPLDRARPRSRERERSEWDANAERTRARDRRDRELEWERERQRDREIHSARAPMAKGDRVALSDRKDERDGDSARFWPASSRPQRDRTPDRRENASSRAPSEPRRQARSPAHRSHSPEASTRHATTTSEAERRAGKSSAGVGASNDREPQVSHVSPPNGTGSSRPAISTDTAKTEASKPATPTGPASTFGNVRPPTGPSYRRRMGLPPVSGPRGPHHHASTGPAGTAFHRPPDPPARSLARKKDAGGAPLVSDLLPVPNYLHAGQSEVTMRDAGEQEQAVQPEQGELHPEYPPYSDEHSQADSLLRDNAEIEAERYHSHLHQQQASQAETSVGQSVEPAVAEHARQDSFASASQSSVHSRQQTGSQSQQARPAMAPPPGLSRLSFSQLNPIATSASSTPGGRPTPGGTFSNVTPNTPAVPGTPFAYSSRTPLASRGGSLSGPPTGPAAGINDGAIPTGPSSRSQSQKPPGLTSNGLQIPTAALAQQLYPKMDPNIALELLSVQTSRLTSVFGLYSARANLRAAQRDVKDADRELEAASLKRDITLEALEKARTGAELASVEEERREVERRRGREKGLFV